jgi:hypothetical protein
MNHESGNEVEPDLGKKPARTKERRVQPVVYVTEGDGKLVKNFRPQEWNNPGEQVRSLRIAALRGRIAGASP